MLHTLLLVSFLDHCLRFWFIHVHILLYHQHILLCHQHILLYHQQEMRTQILFHRRPEESQMWYCRPWFDNRCMHWGIPHNLRSQRDSSRMGALLFHFPCCLHFAWIESESLPWQKVFPKQSRFNLQPYAWFSSQRSVSVGSSDWPKSSVPLFACFDHLYKEAHWVQIVYKSCSLRKLECFSSIKCFKFKLLHIDPTWIVGSPFLLKAVAA